MTLPEQPAPERDNVDEALEETFPASDPPAWEPTHPGPPMRPVAPTRLDPAPAEPRSDPHSDAISRREFSRRFSAAAVSGSIVSSLRDVVPPSDHPVAASAAPAEELCFLPATTLVAMLR